MAANFTLFVTEDEESRVVHVHGSEASDAKIRVGEIYLKTIFTTVVFPHVWLVVFHVQCISESTSARVWYPVLSDPSILLFLDCTLRPSLLISINQLSTKTISLGKQRLLMLCLSIFQMYNALVLHSEGFANCFNFYSLKDSPEKNVILMKDKVRGMRGTDLCWYIASTGIKVYSKIHIIDRELDCTRFNFSNSFKMNLL